MIERVTRAAVLLAGLVLAGTALTGTAGAQGFSGSGAGGVAALQGATASPGYVYGVPDRGAGKAADGPVATTPGSAPRRHRRVAPTEVDFAPRDGRPGAFELPF